MLEKDIIISPRLNTILMVEKVLMDQNDSAVSVAELKRLLPKQINHNTLKIILEYLEDSNKIAVSMKGITWLPVFNRKGIEM
jgi:hypothetical protein